MKSFNKLLVGYSISQFGDRLNQVALLWYVYQVTGSSQSVAFISIFAALPYLMFGFIAGSIVDRYNEKFVLIFSDLIRFVLMFLLFFITIADFKEIYILAIIIFLSSCASTFFEPAKNKIVTKIISKENLLTANSKLSSWQQLARLFAPLLSGMIMTKFHPSYLFLTDSITFLLSLLFLLLIPYKFDKNHLIKQSNSQGKDKFTKGLSFFMTFRKLFYLLILFSVTNFLFYGISVVIPPVLSKDVYNSSSYGYGLMLSAFSGGLLLGALILRKIKISASSKSFLICILLGGLSFMLIGFSNSLEYAAMLFFFCGFFFNISSILFITKLQTEIPVNSQGSAFSLVNTLTIGISPLSTAAISYFITTINSKQLVVYCGLGIVVFCGSFFFKLKDEKVGERRV